MPYLVFISHAWHDKWEAGQLRKELIAAGADCFLAIEGMETGDDFDRRIMQALEEAAELVVLLTPQALDRPTSGSRSGPRGAAASGSSGCCIT